MKHPIRRRFMYLGFQGLRAIAQLLPLRLGRAIGRGLGWFAYWVLPSQRRLIHAHLTYAFGDSLSPSQRIRIARGIFRNLGQNAVEWLILPRLSLSDIQQLVTGEGVEHLRAVLAEGRGAIALTSHFGNWEFIHLYVKSLGFKGGVLARRLRNPEYEPFLVSMRQTKGVATYARSSLRDIARLLRANHIIGILPDQDIDSVEGIFVDFFGHPAYTPIGPAALSLMTGAPIVPCFIIREGERFRLMIEPPLRAPQTADRAEAITALTKAWSERVESYIRRYPDHWVWMHRRWKTKPPSPQSSQPTITQSAAVQSPRLPSVQPVLGLFLVLSVCGFLLAFAAGCAKTATRSAVKAVEKKEEAATTQPSAAPPSLAQQMNGFTLTGYKDDGSKRWVLNGQGANVDGNIVTIQHPDAVGFAPDRKAYITALVAQIDQTNRHVRMEEDVTIHTSDGLWLTSPILHWIPDQNQVATDQPVRIETDHMLLRGRGAEGQTQLKSAKLFKDIELVLNPSDHELQGGGAKQVTITCDGPLSFDYGNSVATFEQNVHVNDPNGDLYSDKLVAYLDQTTHTIRYAEAMGRVRIHQSQNTALSERAVYEPAIGKITLVGKPSLLIYPSQNNQGAELSFGGLLASPAEAAQSKHKGNSVSATKKPKS